MYKCLCAKNGVYFFEYQMCNRKNEKNKVITSDYKFIYRMLKNKTNKTLQNYIIRN